MTFTGPTTLVDVEALARTLPHGDLRSQLIARDCGRRQICASVDNSPDRPEGL